ncbi:MAG: HPr family phosphocarrier protein [Bacillota bacterium]
MVSKTIKVVNPSGIHARPATQVVEFAKNYPGKVEVIKGEKVGDLKSILMVLSMGLKKGTEITLRVTGENEQEFLDSIVEFIQNLEE